MSVTQTSVPSKGWLEFHNPPITLHSGGKSSWKVDAHQLYLNPAIRESVFESWARYLHALRINDFSLVGIERGGIEWADGFSRYTLGSNKDRPSISDKTRIIIVDDVYTTGASLRKQRDLFSTNSIALVVVDRSKNGIWRDLPAHAWMSLDL